MIIYLAPGEPSYIPNGLLNPPQDEVFPDLAHVMRRCADQTFPWDTAAYLAAATDWCSCQEMASELGHSFQEMLAQLEILLQAGLAQERLLVTGPCYRFVGSRRLRVFLRTTLPWDSSKALWSPQSLRR